MTSSAEFCRIVVVHEDLVQKARESMPKENLIRTTGDFFKVLGEPTRIKILIALMSSELCVCDLCAVLNMNQPAISQQLKSLKQVGFVKYRKDGKVVYYSLSDEHIRQIYEMGLIHISEKQEG
ncbi:MAG: metalloregulator ArsR/SmtB family transcription factor [Spirochaetes bacterium]|nr:metalloregulator ArsR/SmtB family transcription factor [Spirochaetota bacterium]